MTSVTALLTNQLMDAIMYYAEQGHDAAYTGPLSIEVTAQVISTSHGPSGSNLEYFEKLLAFIEDIGMEDAHMAELKIAITQKISSSSPS